jgi:dipeptidyl aminopeptidase/acylaminoacyl peptidase
MADQKTAPYGSWKSPITTEVILSDFIGIGQMAVDGEDLYWTEYRPKEEGRNTIVRRAPDGQITEVIPASFNARTRVHEYGGGHFTVAEGVVYFTNFADQRLYRQQPGQDPEPLTPAGHMRYADLRVAPGGERLYCVREDHSGPGEAVNTLVTLELDRLGEGEVLLSGNDFYSSPRLSPGGKRLAWLTWNHPNLPWDGAEVWVGELGKGGVLGERVKVAGGKDESIFQPEWAPDGSLYFVSDRSGWWNLYRWRDGVVESVCQMEAEFGEPQWVFGMSLYGFEPDGRLVCAYSQAGTFHLARLDPQARRLEAFDLPYTEILEVRLSRDFAYLSAASPAEPQVLIRADLLSGEYEILRRSREVKISAGYFSTAQPVEFPTSGGKTAYGYFYPPKNRDYLAPAGEKPPLLVMSHGGPTSATSTSLRYGLQFWTSRGIAVLDVDYGGSSGYGREYRQRLNGQWGVVDVDDCANGARYLVERGLVDGARLAITGGSAGGYTTLCALAFKDIFKAGASHFGIGDLETFVADTHKFESRYLETLIGPYPEKKEVYRERSPIHYTDRLNCKLILFQGLDDKIVPPSQSQAMYEAVRDKGLPVAYLAFEGEQHGFRRVENIKRAIEAELYFYSKVFGFKLADPVEPVEIDNLAEEG